MPSIWSVFGIKKDLKVWGLWKGPLANLAPWFENSKTKSHKLPKYNYSRSYGTYSVSTQCLGTTRSGRQCRRKVHGSYCNSHSGISSYSPRRSSFKSYEKDYSEPYHEPKMCKAENLSGSCNYSTWDGDYCSWHSEAKSIGLPTKKDYEKMIEIFNKAVTNKSPVSFNYHRGSSPGKRRKVIPKEVSTSSNGMTYIRAHDIEAFKELKDNDINYHAEFLAERNFNLTFLREPKPEK